MNRWKKSSFCDNSGCVEMTTDQKGGVWLRSSLSPHPMLTSRADWEAFIAGVKAGEFDLPEVGQ
jgi:hypothetical protein